MQSFEHGKSIEEIGKQSDDLLGEEIGQSIEESGKTMQEKSQEFLKHTQQLASSSSTEVFSECVQAHIDVNRSHIKAVKEFQNKLQTRLDRKNA